MKIRHSLTLVALACSPLAHADIVTEWNEAALNAIRATGAPPPKASRALAMSHLAVYDAVNSITLNHETYLGYQPLVGPTSIEAAAAQAAHSVLSSLFTAPAQTAAFDALLSTHLAGIADPIQKANGMTLGSNAASAMLASRVADNSTSVVNYVNPAPGTIGVWTPTPNAFANYLLPQWKDVTPFAMTSGSQFRPAGAPSINSDYYTSSYNEVKSLGSKTGSTRTADQTDIAFFWADGSGTSTPPGHWNSITQQISSDQGLTLEQNARLFALLNMATADAAIAAWDSKFDEALWRPVTAIRLDDGNPNTLADATWTPLLATPPFPAYISGHSTFSAAAGGVLAEYYGTDMLSFDVISEDIANLPPGYKRSFTSLSDAVDEAGMSRIYGGIHFQFDNEDGKATGAQIGDYVTTNYLRAIPEPATSFLAFLSGSLLLVRRRR
jgi:hypothetical protein